MELSKQILIFLGILLIALFITYFVIDKVRPEALQSLTPKYGVLSKSNDVGTINDVRDKFLSPSGATLMTYLFLGAVGKTGSIKQDENPLTIFKMGSALQLQILPGGVSMPYKTVLKIMTTSLDSSGNKINPYEEIIIPNLPQQSWVHFALVREGRRYTVFYNGEAKASGRTDYFPVVTPAKLTMGDTRIRGEFALTKIADVPLTQDEIKADLESSSNTKHEPYKPFDYSLSMFSFGCPNGIFCFTAKGVPSTYPKQSWSSPYA
jgi:hypothetical protein